MQILFGVQMETTTSLKEEKEEVEVEAQELVFLP